MSLPFSSQAIGTNIYYIRIKYENSLELAKFSASNDVVYNLIIHCSMLAQMTGVGIDNVSNEQRFAKPDDGDAVALDYACLGADEHSVLAGCQI